MIPRVGKSWRKRLTHFKNIVPLIWRTSNECPQKSIIRIPVIILRKIPRFKRRFSFFCVLRSVAFLRDVLGNITLSKQIVSAFSFKILCILISYYLIIQYIDISNDLFICIQKAWIWQHNIYSNIVNYDSIFFNILITSIQLLILLIIIYK